MDVIRPTWTPLLGYAETSLIIKEAKNVSTEEKYDITHVYVPSTKARIPRVDLYQKFSD